MYRRGSRFVALSIFIFLLTTLLIGDAKPAHADVNDFVINNFQADYRLTTEDPQGLLHVKERIDLTFHDFNHGILRALPETYNSQNLHSHVDSVTRADGSKWKFTSSTQNSNLVLKIGDPNITLTGQQTYVISYTMRNVVRFFDDHDELYWNVNGTQWQQPFEKVEATVKLPSQVKLQEGKLVCYTGAFTSSSKICDITANGNTVTTHTLQALGPYETLTYAIGFDKGVFRPATFWDWAKENVEWLVLAIGLPILTFIMATWYWFKRGRDPKGRGVIIPEYGPPKGLTPIESGVIVDFKTDNRDLTSIIIDLAVRGYIKIIETKKDRLIGKDKLDYSFEQTKTDTTGLRVFEKRLLEDLFKNVDPETNTVSVKDLRKQHFYLTATAIRKEVNDELVLFGYFANNPVKVFAKQAAIPSAIFILIALLGKALGYPLLVGLTVSLVIVALYIPLMTKRTAKGVEAKEYIEGLKLYMNTAEADRLKMLQGPNARYAEDYHEPKKTVKLFEKLLPFAVAFGVEKEWAKQFEGIYTDPPDWYSGNWTTFNAVYFASSLNNGVGAIGQSFAAPSSSSSSGFGGGGAGGGGGGGGGGGW